MRISTTYSCSRTGWLYLILMSNIPFGSSFISSQRMAQYTTCEEVEALVTGFVLLPKGELLCEETKMVIIPEGETAAFGADDTLRIKGLHFLVKENATLTMMAPGAMRFERAQGSIEPIFSVFGNIFFEDLHPRASEPDMKLQEMRQGDDDPYGLMQFNANGSVASENGRIRFGTTDITINNDRNLRVANDGLSTSAETVSVQQPHDVGHDRDGDSDGAVDVGGDYKVRAVHEDVNDGSGLRHTDDVGSESTEPARDTTTSASPTVIITQPPIEDSAVGKKHNNGSINSAIDSSSGTNGRAAGGEVGTPETPPSHGAVAPAYTSDDDGENKKDRLRGDGSTATGPTAERDHKQSKGGDQRTLDGSGLSGNTPTGRTWIRPSESARREARTSSRARDSATFVGWRKWKTVGRQLLPNVDKDKEWAAISVNDVVGHISDNGPHQHTLAMSREGGKLDTSTDIITPADVDPKKAHEVMSLRPDLNSEKKSTMSWFGVEQGNDNIPEREREFGAVSEALMTVIDRGTVVVTVQDSKVIKLCCGHKSERRTVATCRSGLDPPGVRSRQIGGL